MPDEPLPFERRLGAFPLGDGHAGFRVWAPKPERVALRVDGREHAMEVMPVAEFPGAHGWGYDGVYLSAAQSSYGGPHGLQRLVDAAHREGLAVLLDVVYNHVGASGTQALRAFGPYFTSQYATPWG